MNQQPCPTCGGSSWNTLMSGVVDERYHTCGAFELLDCARCGTVGTFPQLPMDELLVRYGDDYVSFEETPYRGAPVLRRMVWWPYRARWGEQSILEQLVPGRALDIGCGAGGWLAEAAAHGWRADGLEPNQAAATRACQRIAGAGRVTVSTLEDAPRPPQGYDLIRMSHVLEHLPDPLLALQRASAWLDPGGVLVLQVPNWSSWERRVFGRLWFGLDIPRHTWHFGGHQLERLLGRAGLEVISVRPQRQASCLAGSLQTVLQHVLGREEPFRLWRWLYVLTVPLASLLLAAGEGGTMEVVARKLDDAAS